MKFMLLFDCFNYYSNEGLSAGELALFTLVSCILVSVLLYYYSKITHKRAEHSKQMDSPIYHSKDFFSQEVIGDSNFVLATKTTSVWVKFMVYICIVVIAVSPMLKLLTKGILTYNS